MGQYFTDFRDDPIAPGLPANWTFRWSSFTASIESGNPLDGSSVAFVAIPNGSFSREAASWDAVPEAGVIAVRVDGLFSFVATQSLNNIVSPVICGSGTQATRTGYFVFIRRSGDVELFRAVNGTEVKVANTNRTAIITDVRCIIELSINANGLIELYFWEQSEAKPALPLLSYTDPSPLSAGWCGWFDTGAPTANGVKLYSISAGTDGDPAPTGPAEPFQLRHNPRTNKVIPVLSAPTVTDIGANCVRPRVTKGY